MSGTGSEGGKAASGTGALCPQPTASQKAVTVRKPWASWPATVGGSISRPSAS